jgi:hypothetical protein
MTDAITGIAAAVAIADTAIVDLSLSCWMYCLNNKRVGASDPSFQCDFERTTYAC